MKEMLKVYEEIGKESGYELQKELENRWGYVYVYYLVKGNHKVYVATYYNINDTNYVDIEDIKKEIENEKNKQYTL